MFYGKTYLGIYSGYRFRLHHVFRTTLNYTEIIHSEWWMHVVKFLLWEALIMDQGILEQKNKKIKKALITMFSEVVSISGNVRWLQVVSAARDCQLSVCNMSAVL